MRYEIDLNQIEDLIQCHQPLSETEQRQLESLQRTIAAAMLDEEFRGLADAEDELGVLLCSAARKLAMVAENEGVIGLLASVVVGGIVFTAWLAGLINEPGYAPLMIAKSSIETPAASSNPPCVG